jgi:hypothetical protein
MRLGHGGMSDATAHDIDSTDDCRLLFARFR